MKELGIYVHIPFCKQKCKYCDFVSFTNCEEKYENYFESIIKEIENKRLDTSNTVVSTIYIGGGTPSIVPPKFIEQVINKIRSKFNISNEAEITIEINPGTVNKEKLQYYKNIGINRLSIGLQSADDRLLELIGRIHTYTEFEEAYTLARSMGFKNINVDLMIGLPTQSLEDVKKTLESIIEKNPEHISVYSLIVEEGTKMFDLISNNILQLLDEKIEREMYWFVKNTLEKNGYFQYEISNFSKKGYESHHNMNCWKQMEYIGYGVAAHSYFNNKRFSNINNIVEYIKNCEADNIEKNIILNEEQDKTEQMKEYMLLGLRKIEGVNIEAFKNKFNENSIEIFKCEIDKLINENLIENVDGYIRLTSKGLDLANQVWMEFI